jgi:hypothetical protein
MKYLIVSGCSYTAKHHCWEDKNGKNHVDIKWAEHLKNMIDPNAEVINLGRSGAGNEYIYTSLKDEILKIDPKDILLVMAAWSGSTREDWKVPPSSDSSPPEWVHDNFGHRSNRPSYLHKDSYFMESRTHNWRWSLQRLSEQLGFKYLEFNMLNNLGEDLSKETPTHPMYELMNPILSLTECYAISMGYGVGASIDDMILLKEDRISEDDSHPNAQGHKKIAEWIYNEIQRLGH